MKRICIPSHTCCSDVSKRWELTPSISRTHRVEIQLIRQHVQSCARPCPPPEETDENWQLSSHSLQASFLLTSTTGRRHLWVWKTWSFIYGLFGWHVLSYNLAKDFLHVHLQPLIKKSLGKSLCEGGQPLCSDAGKAQQSGMLWTFHLREAML